MNAETSEHRRFLFAYIAPFAIFMLMTALEGRWELKDHYATLYPIKIALVFLTLLFTRKYWPAFRSVDEESVVRGILWGAVGVVVWIVLAKVDVLSALPDSIREWIGGKRVGFDPDTLPGKLYPRDVFIAVRLFGLAIVVPLMEELFWRGFLMRFLIAEPFHKVPIGTYTRSSFIVVTLAFVAAHPEILAALVWGAAINLLLYRTKNLWACVAMHATTNALLGAYILATGSWHLW